jgi:hypothetical protein
MNLVDLVVFVVVFGLAIFVLKKVWPISPAYDWVFTVIRCLIGLFVVVWLLSLIGFEGHFFHFHLAKLH